LIVELIQMLKVISKTAFFQSGPRMTDFLKEVMEKIGSLLSDSDSFIEGQ
jgi:hypothetical protein